MNDRRWETDSADNVLQTDVQTGPDGMESQETVKQMRDTIVEGFRVPAEEYSGQPEYDGGVFTQENEDEWLNGDIEEPEPAWSGEMEHVGISSMPILQCRDLSCRFGRNMALDHISLDIPRGKIIGLLGPNGSGKTTFMKIANGLLMPSSGELTIEGNRPGPETKKIVSYLPDRDYLPDWMKVEELLKLFEDFYDDFDRARAAEMIHSLGIDEKSRLRSLSKGTREKVQLILTMSRRAALYLLDEPIGGVDPAARDYILNTIISNYNPEGSVLITTHLIADIEQVLDIVLFIDRGQIVLNQSVDEIRQTYGKSVDRYFREVF